MPESYAHQQFGNNYSSTGHHYLGTANHQILVFKIPVFDSPDTGIQNNFVCLSLSFKFTEIHESGYPEHFVDSMR